MNDTAGRPLLDGKELDVAVDHARATLDAPLRAPEPTLLAEPAPCSIAGVALAAARMDQWDAQAARPGGFTGPGRIMGSGRRAVVRGIPWPVLARHHRSHMSLGHHTGRHDVTSCR